VLKIDCQSHVFPAAYAELLTRNQGPLRTTGGQGRYRIDYDGVQQFVLDLDAYSISNKLKAMDAAAIDMSVLSVNIPGPEMLSPELAVEGARLCNDYLADACSRHPDRFVALANLPLCDLQASLEELDRAVMQLDMRGVFFLSHVAGAPVDAPQFEPLYARLAELGVPLVLHPTVPEWGTAIRDHAMIPMVGFMVDTSFAMLRLILGGVLERHPKLKVVHPHAGGILPYLMGRIQEQTEVKGRGREHIRRSPEEYYKNVYLDTVSPSSQALRYAYEFASSDRLLFASDHPWVTIETILDLVEALEMPQADRARILGSNAADLFGIGT
jgi:predicted TIM-barrel fold metal-dependent hydrolase